MSTVGFQAVGQTGRFIDVSADGKPESKDRGLTLDWSTIVAVLVDTVLPDDTIVKAGKKFLRYGQVLCRIGVAEIQTIVLTGGPTGGSFILTYPTDGTNPAQVVVALPFNATAQALLEALSALSRIGLGGVQVTRTGAGTAGDPYTYTVTFNRAAGNVPQFTSTNTFTGGTTPTVTHATPTAGTGGTGAGKFGPYDPAAVDGRQLLEQGDTYIVSRTWLEEQGALSDHPPVYEGGLMWPRRIIMTTGSASLAAGPTIATLKAALPRLTFAKG